MLQRYGSGKRTIVISSTVAAVLMGLSLAAASGLADSSPGNDSQVLATVGNQQITRQQVDRKVLDSVGQSQLYDLRKQALDEMVNEYVLEQAAKKAGLSPEDYMKKQVGPSKVSEAEARQFYNNHQAQIDQQTGKKPFDAIKGALIAALERREDKERRDAILAKLRSADNVKIMLAAPRVSVASAGHPSIGAENAPVTIVEFSDFQCPFCRAAETSIKELREKYGDKVKLVYLDFPLGFHAHAMDAAEAGRCAADQGKFWQFHDALFSNQQKLTPPDLKATAAKIGLDSKRFDQCFDSKEHAAGIKQDQAQGESLGVTGTPTFFVNGRELVGVQQPGKFDEVINEELARAKTNPAEKQARAE